MRSIPSTQVAGWRRYRTGCITGVCETRSRHRHFVVGPAFCYSWWTSSDRGHALQTPIAQAAALTIYGNDVLHGYLRDDFWPASTVFRFCKRVRFVTLEGEPNAPSESL